MSLPEAEYYRPLVTVDVIVFTVLDQRLSVALIQRAIEPFLGGWALPGGFVRSGETLEAAAERELREEVGVGDVYLEQLYTFGDVNRDPRGRVVTVAYFALVAAENVPPLLASTDAAEARWFGVAELPPLAFDHASILAAAVARLRAKLEYSAIAYALLPRAFRLTQLQEVYEVILGRKLDKRNFRKKMLALSLLAETAERAYGAHRPAALYVFKSSAEPTIFEANQK